MTKSKIVSAKASPIRGRSQGSFRPPSNYSCYVSRQAFLAAWSISGRYYLMATPVLISGQEYLDTTYRPDRDFVDGELKERNGGEKKHATVQSIFAVIFHANRRSWGLRAFTEQRVQTSVENYRIADVCVLRVGEPDEPIVHSAPLICIEIRRTYCRCSNFRSLQFEQTVSKMPRVMFTSPLRCPSAPYRRRQRGQRNSPAQ